MARKLRRASCCGGATSVGRSIVRNASKTMEKNMIRQAKTLFDNPLKVIPEVKDAESEKRFKKIKKQLEKVDSIKDDVKKLEKIAKKRSLAGAVAGTLLIAHSEKAPFLAIAKLSSGTVHYAQRGQAPKEYLIAAQHTDDPFYRIFGIRDIAFKYHLHVYSWDSGFISTGIKPNPPREFIDFVLNSLDHIKEGTIVHCAHISKNDIIKENLSDHPYLHIQWRSADVHVGICQQCASNEKNTIFSLTKYLLADDIDEDFSLSVIGSIVKDNAIDTQNETQFMDDYFSGEFTDFQFIQKNMSHRHEKLADKDQQVYILDGTHYEDKDEFIKALNPNSFEKKALKKMLSIHQKPIIVSDATPNDVLSLHWESYGKDIIYDILEDEKLTNDILSLSDSPSVMVKTAYEIKNKQNVLAKLPSYQSLPDIASYADELARIYRVQGKQKLFSALRSPPNHPKKRAIAYGMLLVINKQSDMKWKFSKIDIESGEFIKPYLNILLNGKPDQYHESLQQVLTSCGFSESLEKYRKA
jgi:hypothetical protein